MENLRKRRNPTNKILTLSAPAKINLWLKVGRRDPSGYHSLQTVFQEISLHDTLKFRSLARPSHLPGFILKVKPSGAVLTSNNLILRALDLLRRSLRIKKGMEVELLKKIPVGAGLGGGSSDAACALWGGWILWKGGIKDFLNRKKKVPEILGACAKKLGADVAFFLRGGCAIGEGRGEKLTPISVFPGRWLVLVYPRVHVSTAKAYSMLDRLRRAPAGAPASGGRARGDPLGNDFESVIFSNFPQIENVSKILQNMGCSDVLMTGSGSAVFGFVNSRKMGARIVRALSKKPWDVFLEKTI